MNKERGDIFKLLNERNVQPRLHYPAKLPSTREGKTFSDRQEPTTSVITEPTPRELLKGHLQKTLQPRTVNGHVAPRVTNTRQRQWALPSKPQSGGMGQEAKPIHLLLTGATSRWRRRGTGWETTVQANEKIKQSWAKGIQPKGSHQRQGWAGPRGQGSDRPRSTDSG